MQSFLRLLILFQISELGVKILQLCLQILIRHLQVNVVALHFLETIRKRRCFLQCSLLLIYTHTQLNNLSLVHRLHVLQRCLIILLSLFKRAPRVHQFLLHLEVELFVFHSLTLILIVSALDRLNEFSEILCSQH